MCLSLFWRYKFFYLVAKENHTCLIVVLNGGKRQDSAQFSDQVFFELTSCSEISGTADVDEQHHSQLTFFFKDLYEGMVETRCYIPLDGANVVARHIFT